MDELIKGRMEEGERILWQGGPEPFETLDATNKKRFWITTCLCVVTAIVLLALYILNVKGDQKPAVYAIILVLCGFAPIRRLLDARDLRKQSYVVTDRRLMVVASEAKAVPISRIRECALRCDADGHLSFLAGRSALKAKPSHWRDAALTGNPGAGEAYEPIDSFGFYAVADKAGLRRAIRQVLPNVQE